jgi:hypothetical protein
MAVADFPRDIFRAAKGPKKNHESSEHATDAGNDSTPHSTTAGAADIAPTEVVADTTEAHSDQQSTPSYPNNASTISLAPTISGASTVSALSGTSSGRPTTPHRVRSDTSTSHRSGTASPNLNENIERALGAGKSIQNIVATGVKSPMNFCLGLARGFRNAPKLYNDETVRKPEKVTSFETGLKVAGKEFGLGFYDGISGLVTQPLRGAQKEGGMGFMKGVGKGIGGLLLKPAAGKFHAPIRF